MIHASDLDLIQLAAASARGRVPTQVLDAHEVSRLHQGTKGRFARSVSAWNTRPQLQELLKRGYHSHPTARSIPAPLHAEPPSALLSDALRTRCSCRRFSPRSIPMETIWTLLRTALGPTDRPLPFKATTPFPGRPYPSAGATYSIEFYPVLLSCTDAAPALLHYSARLGALSALRDGVTRQEFARLIQAEPAVIAGAALGIIVTAVLPRACEKYLGRGYRFALLEAGHAMQNLMLVAESLGLGTLELGGGLDREVERFVHADGTHEVYVSVLLAGEAAPDGSA